MSATALLATALLAPVPVAAAIGLARQRGGAATHRRTGKPGGATGAFCAARPLTRAWRSRDSGSNG
jgi:hypothetical protein